MAIEEQDPLPNDDLNDDTPQPVNSEFITIKVASNQNGDKINGENQNGYDVFMIVSLFMCT